VIRNEVIRIGNIHSLKQTRVAIFWIFVTRAGYFEGSEGAWRNLSNLAGSHRWRWRHVLEALFFERDTLEVRKERKRLKDIVD
jgi:hypothetical protein